MADEKLADKIEAWLKGEMPEAEARAFQASIDADPALAEEVELHQLTLRSMEHLSEQHLQQNVLAWMDAAETNRPKSSTVLFSFPTGFWVLAALLLLSVFLLIHQIRRNKSLHARVEALSIEVESRDSLIIELSKKNTYDPSMVDSLLLENERLRNELSGKGKPPGPFAFYKKPTVWDSGGRMGEDPASLQFYKEGISYFQKSDMKGAEEKARKALEIEPDNRDAMRLLSHALFVQQRFEEAADVFEKMQHEYAATSAGAKEAEWNRMLCYLGLSEKVDYQKRFQELLNTILHNPNHPYYDRARLVRDAIRF